MKDIREYIYKAKILLKIIENNVKIKWQSVPKNDIIYLINIITIIYIMIEIDI